MVDSDDPCRLDATPTVKEAKSLRRLRLLLFINAVYTLLSFLAAAVLLRRSVSGNDIFALLACLSMASSTLIALPLFYIFAYRCPRCGRHLIILSVAVSSGQRERVCDRCHLDVSTALV